MDFNNQWIEIFRTGDYGAKGRYDADDLDKMVANFAHWKPPLVLGHPENDSPAMGWASQLKREGERLLALTEKVQPQLEAHVSSGRFPNRSIAIYKDPKGSGPAVRHIGFLGAAPPEVKGLAPVQFSDGDFVAIDFKEEDEMDENAVKKTVAAEIKAFFTGLFGEKQPAAPAFDQAQFTETVTKAVNAAVEPLKTQITTLSEENKKLREGTETATKDARISEVRTFAEGLKNAGKWVPALDGILPIIETAAAAGQKVKFNEGTAAAPKEVELPAFDAFKRFAESLGQIVPLGVVAGGALKTNVIEFTEAKGIGLDQASLAVNTLAEEIAADLRKQDPKLSESDAFSEGLRRARRKVNAQAGAIAVGKV